MSRHGAVPSAPGGSFPGATLAAAQVRTGPLSHSDPLINSWRLKPCLRLFTSTQPIRRHNPTRLVLMQNSVPTGSPGSGVTSYVLRIIHVLEVLQKINYKTSRALFHSGSQLHCDFNLFFICGSCPIFYPFFSQL